MTIEERLSLLEQQIAAQVPTPTEYYTSRWSGEEIDKGIGGALQLGGATTPQAALRNIGGRPNRNLLDNAYFKGGGSQQGGGQFPINQRGQKSYSGNGYGLDRWRIGSSGTLTISADYIEFSSNDAEMRNLEQPSNDLPPGIYTLSFIVANGGGVNVLCGHDGSYSSVHIDGDQKQLVFVTFTKVDSAPVTTYLQTANKTVKVYAAKLELGPTQTLAYQDEDGNWQLFETPDYGEELAKCRYYFRRYGVSSLGQIYLPPALGVSGAEANFSIVSEPMRIAPTISGNRFFLAGTTGDGFIADGSASFSLLGASPLSGIITIRVTCSNRTLIPGNYYTLYASQDYGAFLDLSAEL